MTTALLSAVATSPFGKHFDHEPYQPGVFSGFYHTPGKGSSSSPLALNRSTAISPASTPSLTSTKTTCNNENFAPLPASDRLQTPSVPCLAAPLSTTDKIRKRWVKSTPKSAGSPRTVREQHPPKIALRSPCNKESSQHFEYGSPVQNDQRIKAILEDKERKPVTRHETSQERLQTIQLPLLDDTILLEPFPSLNLAGPLTPPVVKPLKQSDEAHVSLSNRHKLIEVSPHRQPGRQHRHRLSEASSVFVHTLRTASTSNGSFSIRNKSLGMSRSSEGQPNSDRPPRFSVDSERPLTTSSIDEAAVLRGAKRKQIVQELINTEESYVADLKALIYLYSTLLASAASISDTARTAIQRNVIGLLHLHEILNAKLHQVVFKAAARSWADTVTPSRLRPFRNPRWRTSEGQRNDRHARNNRQTWGSVDSADIFKTQSTLGTTDPMDILDIANIFQDSLTAFFAYEEYCANHELIAHELQRQTPMLWSTYETGMESLGRNLVAIDQKTYQDKKGLTVRDLLIKPIQRICKYPLILEDLLRCTPVVDSPGTHGVLDTVLQRLKEIVLAVNMATDNHHVRLQIQRRWLIQDRLNINDTGISTEHLRELGQIHLCGVLYAIYQTATVIDGCYAFCILFDSHFIVAVPARSPGKFHLLCLINLADLRVQPADDGKGIQCQSALHTWKVSFMVQGHYREIVLSACSTIEEEQWLQGLQGAYKPAEQHLSPSLRFVTQIYLDLKSVGIVFGPNIPLSRKSSIQRAATVCNKVSSCQVILRNTHNAQDLQEYRNTLPSMVNRSQSHATTNKAVVLAPKRSERSRLEAMLSDVWTKEKLPFPGMIVSKSSQILRASAGSLVRKLSLASIHAPFSRRSESLTVSSQRSHETLFDRRRVTPAFQVRKDSIEGSTPVRTNGPREWSELDTMDKVVGRMIGSGTTSVKRLSLSSGDKLRYRSIQNNKTRRNSVGQIGPEDPASVFYKDDEATENAAKEMADLEAHEKAVMVELSLAGAGRKKRWSNPIAMLKEIGSDGLRSMLHSSSCDKERDITMVIIGKA